MKTLTKLAAAHAALAVLLLGGCAGGHVKPSDRDTSGAYDGVWIGEVGGPRAHRAKLAGQWFMTCDWEPFDIVLTVDDGRVQLGRLEGRTPVSGEGRFRIDLSSGPAGMTSGVMSGNGEYVDIFSGRFGGNEPSGKYVQYITSIGNYGCSAPITLRRADGSAV